MSEFDKLDMICRRAKVSYTIRLGYEPDKKTGGPGRAYYRMRLKSANKHITYLHSKWTKGRKLNDVSNKIMEILKALSKQD